MSFHSRKLHIFGFLTRIVAMSSRAIFFFVFSGCAVNHFCSRSLPWRLNSSMNCICWATARTSTHCVLLSHKFAVIKHVVNVQVGGGHFSKINQPDSGATCGRKWWLSMLDTFYCLWPTGLWPLPFWIWPLPFWLCRWLCFWFCLWRLPLTFTLYLQPNDQRQRQRSRRWTGREKVL